MGLGAAETAGLRATDRFGVAKSATVVALYGWEDVGLYWEGCVEHEDFVRKNLTGEGKDDGAGGDPVNARLGDNFPIEASGFQDLPTSLTEGNSRDYFLHGPGRRHTPNQTHPSYVVGWN